MLSESEKKIVLEFLSPFLENADVQSMKNYIQHGAVSTYDHCLSVAHKAYELAKKLHTSVDMSELLTAAFLHDFYLYDWHEPDKSHKWHGFHHAERAAENAVRIFGVSEPVRKAITSHMWPLNLTRIPTTKVAWILTLADRAVSIRETLLMRKPTADRQMQTVN